MVSSFRQFLSKELNEEQKQEKQMPTFHFVLSALIAVVAAIDANNL